MDGSDAYINPLEQEVTPVEFVNLGTLADDMIYRLPGCADVMVRRTLQSVFREFCTVTWAMRATVKIPLIAGERSYRIIIPSQTYILNVVGVWRGETRHPMTGGRDYSIVTGSPVTLHLPSAPIQEEQDEGVLIEVEVALVPTRGSEDVPMWFADRYSDALISGAMFRLLAMEGRPWSDKAQAAMESIAWQNALSSASVKSISGSQSGGIRLDAVNYGGML